MRIARLVAVAALVASAALAAPPAASATATPTPTHVAIVVAGDRNACLPWHAGMTGADVLTAGGYSTYYATSGPYAGLLLQIDGVPTKPDPSSAYWSYWQNGGSGWLYAQQGPASSQPQPGSVEGWKYISMSYNPSNAPRPPADSYASICAGQDPVAAPATSHATSPRPSTSAPSSASQPSASPTGASVAATTAGRVASGAASARSSTTAHRTAGAATPTQTDSASSASPTSSGSSSPVAARGSSPSELPTVGTVAALVVVVALGAGSYLYSRRQRR